jgi:hypothetical protein
MLQLMLQGYAFAFLRRAARSNKALRTSPSRHSPRPRNRRRPFLHRSQFHAICHAPHQRVFCRAFFAQPEKFRLAHAPRAIRPLIGTQMSFFKLKESAHMEKSERSRA